MNKATLPAALFAVLGSTLLAPPAQAASTQIVGFSIAGAYCPDYGVYGISHVYVNGNAGMTADQNFIWNTQTASTSISSVPEEGALANVTVVYHCNVKVLWWFEAGGNRQATTTAWVYGSGWQPTYTLYP